LLATNPQSLDELPVSLHILTFQIVEKLPSAADHSKKTVPGVVILLVEGQVLAEGINPRTQKGNLDLWRAGILVVSMKFFDPLLFLSQLPCHTSTPLSSASDVTIRPYQCKAQFA
jgi:hypothetical protein